MLNVPNHVMPAKAGIPPASSPYIPLGETPAFAGATVKEEEANHG